MLQNIECLLSSCLIVIVQTINNQTAYGQISPGTSSAAVAALISRANAEQASARMLAQKVCMCVI